LLNGVEGRQEVAAHVEIDLAGQQHRAPADLRAALQDGDVEATGGIGAVGHGLVVAAMLWLGQPVGAEGHLLVRSRTQCAGGKQRDRASRNLLFSVHRHHPLFAPEHHAPGSTPLV